MSGSEMVLFFVGCLFGGLFYWFVFFTDYKYVENKYALEKGYKVKCVNLETDDVYVEWKDECENLLTITPN